MKAPNSTSRIAIAVAIAAVLIAGTASALAGGHYKSAEAEMDIVETAVAAGSFNTLVTAVQEAGLVETLKGDGPFTVFAPTDAAFAAVPAETLEALLQDKEALTSVLTYHVVAGRYEASDVVSRSSIPSVQGKAITVSTDSGAMVDGAKIVKTDIQCSNGVIHVIDAVIMP
jgi:uncharacterized surface protein with fasciclin (FAS1) repeats